MAQIFNNFDRQPIGNFSVCRLELLHICMHKHHMRRNAIVVTTNNIKILPGQPPFSNQPQAHAKEDTGTGITKTEIIMIHTSCHTIAHQDCQLSQGWQMESQAKPLIYASVIRFVWSPSVIVPVCSRIVPISLPVLLYSTALPQAASCRENRLQTSSNFVPIWLTRVRYIMTYVWSYVQK